MISFFLKHVALQIIQILFASNSLQKKYSTAKCVICETESRRVEIRLTETR